jgi:hypothetical protein
MASPQTTRYRSKETKLAFMGAPELATCEDECVVCREWPAALRPTMRFGLLSIPFTGMCEACFRAWWRNLTGQELAAE